MAKIVSTGKTISTAEYLEKRNREKRKKRMALTATLFLLLVGLVCVSRLDKFQIRNVIVSGAASTGADTVKDAILEKLSGHYLWLVPHSNTLLYRKDKMKEELSKRFPRLSRIDISLDDLNTLKVDVSERVPFALYCEGSEACWFLDKEGFIFDQAPNFSEGVYFAYSLTPALESPAGHAVLPLEKFAAVSDFVSALPDLGFQPVNLSIEGPDYYLNMKNGSRLIWKEGIDLPRTLNNLNAFLSSSAIKTQKDFLEKVSFLDLRTEDKVFYQFKN